MYILSYRNFVNPNRNIGFFVDRDDARAACENHIRNTLKEYGQDNGMFFLEEVKPDGLLKNPVEFVVEICEHEYEFLVEQWHKLRAARTDI